MIHERTASDSTPRATSASSPSHRQRTPLPSRDVRRGLARLVVGAFTLGFGVGCGQGEAPRTDQIAAPAAGVVGRWGPSEADVKRLAQLDMATMRSKDFLFSGADLQKRLNGEVGSDTYRIEIVGDKERQQQREKIQKMSDAELEQYARGGIVLETLTFQAGGGLKYTSKWGVTTFDGRWIQDGDGVTATIQMPKELVEPFGPEIVLKVHLSGDRLVDTEVTGEKTPFMLKNADATRDALIREWTRTK